MDPMTSKIADTYLAWIAAGDEFSRLLEKHFGKEAGDMHYTSKDRWPTEIRRAYEKLDMLHRRYWDYVQNQKENNYMKAQQTKMHKFTEAGLGQAPFRVLKVEYRVGPYIYEDPKTGITTTIGSAGQPMGSCDYCSRGIAECWVIRSTDGKESIVGSACVRKTGDAGLRKIVDKHQAKLRVERESKRIEAFLARLAEDQELQALLESKPHPNNYWASQGKTMLDSVSWLLNNAGHSGQLRAVRAAARIEKEN